jgi:hypothetical protein
LSLYQSEAGALTDGQHADSLAMVQVLAETVLSLHDEVPSGSLAAAVVHGSLRLDDNDRPGQTGTREQR